MSAHSLNGPSSFARRRACPGSARMEKDIPSQSSPYAAEGTAAHELGERCLKTGKNPADFKGEIIKTRDGDFEVVPDMIHAVEEYVDYCRPLLGEHMIEKKVKLPFLGAGTKGTADFIALKDGVLHVVDYKHGKGVPVEAHENIQGLCYGLGAASIYELADWDILRITIVQPRAYHDEGGIRSWDVPREDMFDWIMDFAAAAKATEDPKAPLVVNDYCRFCKAKPQCPAQYEFAKQTAEMDFDDMTSKPLPIDFMSDEKIADLVLNKIKMIEQWCQSVKDYAQHKAEAGTPLPGTKLVATRAVRMWKDADAAEKILKKKFGDEIYEKKFVTAPKFEKLVGKKEFKDYESMVDKVSTGVTLVAESDPRDSARVSAEDEFA